MADVHDKAGCSTYFSALIIFGPINAIAPTVAEHFRTDLVEAPLTGFVLGQSGALAVFAVLGSTPLLKRLAICLTLLLSLYAAVVVGFYLVSPTKPLGLTVSHMFRAGFAVPAVFLAVQFPIWVARLWREWRIVYVSEENIQSGRQSSVGEMLIVTGMIAVSLSMARLSAEPSSQDHWGTILIACAVAAVLSSLTTITTTIAVFGRQGIRSGMFWMTLYAIALGASVGVLPAMVRGGSIDVQRVATFGLFAAGVIGPIFASLAAAHASGYELQRPKRNMAKNPRKAASIRLQVLGAIPLDL